MEKKILSGTLEDSRGPLVEYAAEYPDLPGPAGAYGRNIARQQAALAKKLLPAARAQRQLQGETSFCPYRLEGTVTVTYDRCGVRSMVGDRVIWLGLRGTRRSRWSVILDKRGRPLPFTALLRGRFPREAVLRCILEQASALTADGCTLYRDWTRRCRTGFDPNRCYLTEEGVAFWYPWLFLGPACAGAPTFPVPRTKLENCLNLPG